MYKVVYPEQAAEDFDSLDKTNGWKIINRLENYLAQDPKFFGEPFKGDFSGYWRYRWGADGSGIPWPQGADA